ncbi:MAG TPA: DNA translocase FtsK 4TM domain-containing protein, partial [Nitrospiraceae bacterium]
MGASTTAKRGDARRASSPPSHLKREVIGVVLIALSLLTLLSLVSFVPGEGKVLSGSLAPPPRNLIGSVGALFASSLFFLIGGAAYLFPLLLGLIGVRCFTQSTLSIRIRNGAASLGVLLFLSGFLHLEVTAVPTVSSGFVYRGIAGGICGQVLAEGLRTYFASTGAHILIIAGFLVSMLYTTPVSLAQLALRLSEWWSRAVSRISALMPERGPAPELEAPVKKAKAKAAKSIRSVIEEVLPATEPSPVVDSSVAQPLPKPVEEAPEPLETEPEPQISAAQDEADDYVLPDPAELLSEPSGALARMTEEELKAQSEILARALLSFGIEGKVTDVRPGPVVTMYEFEPAPGTKVARIVNLADDLALAMKAISLRIVAPLPGKSVVGIEVPNPYRETVSLKDVVTSEVFTRARSKLTLALGKDI